LLGTDMLQFVSDDWQQHFYPSHTPSFVPKQRSASIPF